ncbi:MAG: heme lyase CcmF/NrfE family subunit [Solirubrobacterales bacterium]|nr:heme lyase CcmF/NrfE family subunit [Solirubrobacterales bacterium]
MTTLGSATLAASLLVALYAAGAAIYGARTHDRRWVVSSRRAVYALGVLLTVAVLILEHAFLTNDFGFEIVAEHSSTTTPTLYKLTAMWSSQPGGLLLWAWLLSLASSAVLYLTRNRHREIAPWATAVLMGLGAFFIGLLIFGAPPFTKLSPAPMEGSGLNPLLRNPYMVAHPPMLYSGYVFFSIPFAFAIGALITRRLDTSWIRSTRRFALIAWTLLAIGLLLGSRWSYEELNWGGYWGWDAVENAALMPWLVGTAFLHSIMVQERRGMLKVWNVSLIVGTFSLALLGTFLVRSGVIESIHAFGASTVGGPLLVLLGIVLIGSTLLIISRLDDLKPERRLNSGLSRESIFLINNLLLVGLAFVILWGTLFPLLSEAVTGERASVGAAFFEKITTPFGVLLVLFTGIGPLIGWGRTTPGAVGRVLAWPAAIAALAVVALLVGGVERRPLAIVLFAFATFALVALAQEFWRAGSARRAMSGGSFPAALGGAVLRNRRRYGGYTAHIGIAILLIGVAASSSFQHSSDLRLGVGKSGTVGDYKLTYRKLTVDLKNERIAFGAALDVSKDGERVDTLRPARNYYPSSDPSVGPIARYYEGEATSEVGMRSGLGGDLWTAFQPDLSSLDAKIKEGDRKFSDFPPDAQGLVVAGIAASYTDNPPPASFRANTNPLVIWIWLGGLIAVSGALFAVWPTAEGRRRVEAVYAARLGRELTRA